MPNTLIEVRKFCSFAEQRIYYFFGRNRANESGYSMRLWTIERCGWTVHAGERQKKYQAEADSDAIRESPVGAVVLFFESPS